MTSYSRLGKMIHLKKWDELSAYVLGSFGLDIPARQLALFCKKAPPLCDSPHTNWSDGTWRMWLRNRLDEAGYFIPGGRSGQSINEPTSLLHIGFLSLEETEEMLLRLRWDDEVIDQPIPRRASDSVVVLSPIDRVAGRVTGIKSLEPAHG